MRLPASAARVRCSMVAALSARRLFSALSIISVSSAFTRSMRCTKLDRRLSRMARPEAAVQAGHRGQGKHLGQAAGKGASVRRRAGSMWVLQARLGHPLHSQYRRSAAQFSEGK